MAQSVTATSSFAALSSQAHVVPSTSPKLLRNNPKFQKNNACASSRSLRIRASAEVQSAVSAASKAVPALLKKAAKDKSVEASELVPALIALEKASRAEKAPSDETLLLGLGGSKSPGKLWKLVFTSNGKLDPSAAKGSYFPILAMQRFDAEAMEIENGVFFGPIGYLTFKGPLSFKNRCLFFLFDTLSLKLGPLPEFSFNISSKRRIPGKDKDGKKDPFFSWFYVDDDVVVGRGRGGGVAFWTKYEGPYK